MKRSFKQRWTAKSILEKIIVIISTILALCILLSCALMPFGKISNTVMNATLYPCLFFLTLLNAIRMLKEDKKNAILIFACSIVILGCGILALLF